MRYIVCDERRDGNGDLFAKEFNDVNAAIEEAKDQWYHLVTAERKARKVYVLESVNPDEEAEDHFDGNYIWDSDRQGREMEGGLEEV